MALGYKSLIKIRCVSHFHVPQSCMSWAQAKYLICLSISYLYYRFCSQHFSFVDIFWLTQKIIIIK